MDATRQTGRGKRQAIRNLSASECAEIAASIRAGVAALGITLPLNASVEEMARDAEWLASFGRGPFEAGGAVGADKNRGLRAFVRMEQARRIADLLTQVTSLRGVRDQAKRWIRERLDRTETQDAQGQDLLFELEIAGRLARWPGIGVELGEPDIVVTLPNAPAPGSFVLACKRPRSIGSCGRAIESAGRQIRSAGMPGVIVIGTEAIFHRSEDEMRPVMVYTAPTTRDAKRFGEDILEQIAVRTTVHQGRAFRHGIEGALLCGLLTYWCERPSAYAFAWIRRVLPGANGPDSKTTIEGLDILLFEHARLRRALDRLP